MKPSRPPCIRAQGRRCVFRQLRVQAALRYSSTRLRASRVVHGGRLAFMYSLNSTNRIWRSCAQCRMYLKYQLTSVNGVSEVASVGGSSKQYQVSVGSRQAAGLPTFPLRTSAWPFNAATAKSEPFDGAGGEGIHPASARLTQSLDDLKKIALSVGANGVPVLLGQVAEVQLGRTCAAASRMERRGRNRWRHRRRPLRRKCAPRSSRM